MTDSRGGGKDNARRELYYFLRGHARRRVRGPIGGIIDAFARQRVPPSREPVMQDKKFASHADLEEKQVSFDKLSDHAYAYTAEGDPNTASSSATMRRW
jgi:hypothetical protein